MPALFSEQFIGNIGGKTWIGLSAILILLGVMKIEQVEIRNEQLTKTNPLFKRSIELKNIIRFKIRANNMDDYPQYNIAAILKFLRKDGNRYSNFRFLTVYGLDNRKLTIDERTMPTADFTSILKEVKRAQKTSNNC